MKKHLTGIMFALVVSFSASSAQSVNYKLITVASYLNFYLLNLNACEDFHPTVRKSALAAENAIYPWLEALNVKIVEYKLNNKDKAAIANTVVDRRTELNEQIAENEFTIDHCETIIDIVKSGLDSSLLKVLE
jgi:hypothetical protein